uniref:Uncharacterized protein n=1 Tax=Candidatus Giovannonibacteria bacterium GW2011_GWF2_42_19 TaxID=1618659 RepID=A0A0G1CGH0_9BACT|nr:MAG: hypothetical protein UV11_C0006G0063 [Candidatus Giovannonibacteria bacterium GW2011_GWF2_42_19]
MSDKALITDEELELAQKFLRQFPRGVHPNIIKELNGSPKEIFDMNFRQFLQNKGRMQFITTGIAPPPNGIVILLTIPVNESREWNGAVKAAGPDTDRNSGIWKVGDQFPGSAGTVERLEQIWLVNFGKGSVTSSQNALDWGEEQHLVPDSPRANFAIAEHFPKLNTYLGMDLMAIISLRTCSFEGDDHATRVWFLGAERIAYLVWFENVWSDDYWFAFVRELGVGNLGS